MSDQKSDERAKPHMVQAPNILSNLQASVPDVLRHICQKKAEHVAACKEQLSLNELEKAAAQQSQPRGFEAALRVHEAEGRFGLIAELKRASPSKGLIREDFDPKSLAKAYEKGGASCLSVLTDKPFFQGEDSFLVDARAAVSLPCLRKDFMIDPYQVYEARALGADAILLIMAALEDQQVVELEMIAQDLGMNALIEVHNEAELERALSYLQSDLLGINNRDLVRLETDLGTTEYLSGLIPDNKLMVSESGLFTHEDLQQMAICGARSFLIGESLMRHEDVAAATKAILFGGKNSA